MCHLMITEYRRCDHVRFEIQYCHDAPIILGPRSKTYRAVQFYMREEIWKKFYSKTTVKFTEKMANCEEWPGYIMQREESCCDRAPERQREGVEGRCLGNRYTIEYENGG